jgi:hypothetical protein
MVRTSIRAVAIVALIFGFFAVSRPAAAAVTGTYSGFTFPGASASNCGALHVSGATVWTAPGNYSDVATDGTGAVVASLTGSWVGTSPGYGNFFSTQPKQNPIHWRIIGDGAVLFDGYADNPCLPPSGAAFQGPPIPAGFVLKTITCDVAVYDAPGGNPVGSDALKSGQTWYVNPTPKKDAAGKSWTEVFVAGYTNGYVPTSCVH